MDENKEISKPIIMSRPEDPDNPAWRDYWLKSKHSEITKFEETAKFLTGLVSILFTIFQVNASAYKAASAQLVSNIGIFAFILSVLFSLLVLFPAKYKYIKDSVPSIKKAHDNIVNRKRTMLIVSTAFFVLALSCFSWAYMQGIGKNEAKVENEKYIILYKDSLLIQDKLDKNDSFFLRKSKK